ncbi:hypothetical protein SCWH03_57000 [Streptomyces pacificus]|uniref:Uncharacterized protein n=1 Tax=Streptomyces pacificus TaxID=2705029 RepID=A0A6A0B401_9ACTN|nr:hypothetical protein SCWH03_57000 [Streptomyces pacificus]
MRENPLGPDAPAVPSVGPLLREPIIEYIRTEDGGSPQRTRLRAVLLDQLRISVLQPRICPPRPARCCAESAAFWAQTPRTAARWPDWDVRPGRASVHSPACSPATWG